MTTERTGPTPGRLELAQKVAELRNQGLTHQAVAERFGISRSYAAELVLDPVGAKRRKRRDSYQGVCERCGGVTQSDGTSKPSRFCSQCGPAQGGKKSKVWTEERVIAAIQWWDDRYGEPPALVDWSPTQARHLGDEERALRAERHIAAREIPWFTSAVRAFGSWNDAIRAAGFEPRQPNGAGGNALRARRARSRVAA